MKDRTTRPPAPIWLLAVLVIASCDRKPAAVQPSTGGGRSSSSQTPPPTTPTTVTPLWHTLLAALADPSADAAPLFTALSQSDPAALRHAPCSIPPEAGDPINTNKILAEGVLFEFTTPRLRALDDLVTRQIAADPDRAAKAINALDSLLAAAMRAAAQHNALTLYKMTAAWRAQMLTRLAAIPAGEPFEPRPRLEKVRAALTAPISPDVP